MEAVVATSRARLAEIVGQWPEADGETTWAVVFASVVPTASELAAVREAARMCDRVVVARLTPDRVAPPGLAKLVREAGGDVLFNPSEVVGRAEVKIGGEKADTATVTLMMQTLLTVLPLAVMASRTDVEVVRTLRGLQASFGDFINLKVL